jgi:hypothetical protein
MAERVVLRVAAVPSTAARSRGYGRYVMGLLGVPDRLIVTAP